MFLSSLESGNFPDSGLPVAEILVLAGFLMIYLLEEALHLLLVKCGPLKEDEKSGGEHSQSYLKVTLVKAMGTAMGRLRCQQRTESLQQLVDSSLSSLSPSTTSLKESPSVWQGYFLFSILDSAKLPPLMCIGKVLQKAKVLQNWSPRALTNLIPGNK